MDKKYHYKQNCHFLLNGKSCKLLKNFYNFPDLNACGECPFFKTTEEFKKGFYRHGNETII